MRQIGSLASACLFAMLLSACNTSEALTPRADIGQPGRPSAPVTQAETERMARGGEPENLRNSGGQSLSGRYPPNQMQGQMPGQAPGQFASGQYSPRGSLQSQADALDSGRSVSPASSGPPPQWQGKEQQAAQPPASPLSQPAEPGQSGGPAAGSGDVAAAPQGQPATAAPASVGAEGTIRFLPIIGAPVEAVTPLSRRLAAEARAAGLTIRPSGDAGTQTMLKGYFSAFAAEGNVTVVYVWDILDPSGARLHRMQGQESVRGGGADPWAAVPASVMETIAAKTMQDYMAWRRAQPG